MSNNIKSSSSSGIGALGLLGVAFVVLKLTGYITWSWWWVTVPFWGGLVLFVVIGFVVLLGLFLFTIAEHIIGGK